jgi:hypothetical protein
MIGKRFAATMLATAFATTAPANASTTKIVPYAAASMTVTQRAKGSCWTTSIASTRSDAFRCMAGNSIHDPCFVRSSSAVVCPENLVKNSGLSLTLTAALPAPASPQGAQPWAMVLAGGKACNRATGTVDPDYPFYCQGKAGACSAPDISSRKDRSSITCATVVGGKPTNISHPAVAIVYE